MAKNKTLSNCEIFKGIKAPALGSIGAISEEVVVEQGDKIFSKAGEATYLYIINSGSVKLCLPVSILLREVEIDVEVKHPGDMIGWSALVPPHERALSAYAVEKSELLRIPGKELRALCEQDEHLSYLVISRVAAVIGHRLIRFDQMLAKEIELNASSM